MLLLDEDLNRKMKVNVRGDAIEHIDAYTKSFVTVQIYQAGQST